MKNRTQIERYHNLLTFIEEKFKEDIQIKDVEDTSFYSYRNINRIFFALHHETIGHYIKRRKLEKAAEYIKFSELPISDIGFEIGYGDLAAFSKAFKKQFNCSPSSFRNSMKLQEQITLEALGPVVETNKMLLDYVIEEIPEMDILYVTYQGSYENIKQIKKTWENLVLYALQHHILNDETIILGEILDDDAITENLLCRYNAAIVLEKPLDFQLQGMFKTKTIAQQKYAKFIHKGSHESCIDTYNLIYAHWITEISLELSDKPTLEFYLNDEEDTPKKDLITEIYIPVE